MSKSSQSSSSNEFSAVNMILNLKKTDIVDVWEHNFEEEIYKIMDLIETYNIIAIVIINTIIFLCLKFYRILSSQVF